MQNSGNTTWREVDGFKLIVITDDCALLPAGIATMTSGAVVQPGQSYTFNFILTAPGSLTTCSFSVKMTDGVVPFGALVSSSIQIVDPVNDANILSHTIPVKMFVGQTLGVDITVRNRGNTTWMPGGAYHLGVNSDPCGMFVVQPINPLEAVSPNKNTSILTWVTAPGSPGSCAFELQMTEDGSGAFGTKLNFTVNVILKPNATRNWTLFE